MSRPNPASDRRMTEAFDANAADLLAYLERRVLPREDAADVLGEAMIIAWRKVKRLPDDAQEARMWLFAIAKNTLLNHRRSATRRLAAIERLRAEIRSDIAAGAADDADRLDVRLRVRAALTTLPPELEELVKLVLWDGFTLADAARLAGTPTSTVRSRYARALAMLAAELGEGSAVRSLSESAAR